MNFLIFINCICCLIIIVGWVYLSQFKLVSKKKQLDKMIVEIEELGNLIMQQNEEIVTAIDPVAEENEILQELKRKLREVDEKITKHEKTVR